MSTYPMEKLISIALLVVPIFTATTKVQAAFDAIVPSEVEFRTTSYYATSTGGWGLIVSTTDTLSLFDLQNAKFTATISDPLITVENQSFFNEGYFAPLSPGEAAGIIVSTNIVYDSLLLPGESLKIHHVPFWGFHISYPEGYTATVSLDASVMIGSDFVNYSTEVNFGDFTSVFRVVSGQRLSSIPEPATLLLLGLGAVLVRRKR